MRRFLDDIDRQAEAEGRAISSANQNRIESSCRPGRPSHRRLGSNYRSAAARQIRNVMLHADEMKGQDK
jgi:hypothetical protein